MLKVSFSSTEIVEEKIKKLIFLVFIGINVECF